MTAGTLRQRAVRGVAWTLPTSIGSRMIGLIGTLLLARYLAPDEYGVVMAACVAAITANSVTLFGVGTWLVAHPNLSRAETFHASCWFLVTGVVALGGALLSGGPLERWSSAPGLAAFLPILILATLLDRIVYVPERILVRTLRFGWLSVARALGEVIYTVTAVILAAYGLGAMAIVWGSLARSAVRAVTIVPAVKIRDWLEPHRLHLPTLRRIVAYGLNVSLASAAGFGMRRWDNLLISRYFGPGVMGAYNYAYNLADTPATTVGEQMSDVLAASLPHVDPRGRAMALVHSCTILSLILLPLSVGLAAVAPTVVETVFDPRWSQVGAMLTCLSALSIARPLGNLFSSYFYASDRPGIVLWLEVGSLLGVIGAIAALGHVGINWACAGVSLVFILRTVIGMWIVCRQDGLPPRHALAPTSDARAAGLGSESSVGLGGDSGVGLGGDNGVGLGGDGRVGLSAFLQPIAGPLIACVVMAVGVTAIRLALGGVTPAARLVVEIAIGAAIYVGGVLLLARSTCDELWRAVRVSRRAPAEPGPARSPRVLSLSTEFPNPSEPGKGLFVRARLEAIASRAPLFVIAPVASLDYANPRRDLLAARRIPRERDEGGMRVLHPRWLYPPRGGWMNAWFLFARLLPLQIALRARRPFDVIDAHFAHPEGIAAVLLGRVFRCPVIVTVRGSELRYYRQRSKRFWMSWALRRADRVIAVSDGLRELAIALGVDPRRVKTVPNGIKAEVFFRRDRMACRSRHGVGADERIILSAGDLAELKGHHRVMTAVKALNDRGVRARLLIAGGVGRSGRYADTLRRQMATQGLANQVAFLGEVTQEALAELMSAADVFCLASSTEGWPNVVNEALACGTPVVATDVGAVRQMIRGHHDGTVVPVHDAEALADALQAALTRDWDREAISARGRSRSWAHVADEVLTEMRTVIAEHSSLKLGFS